MRVRLESIGCRLNIAEMEAVARELAGAGHRVVGPGEPAELCVFNSCTVTAVASGKSRQIIRQLRRAHPAATLVATGCYSELAEQQVRALGVDLVVGNREKDRLPAILHGAGLLTQVDTGERLESDRQRPAGRHGRTRAFLKVQDGCDNRCTFCVVTIARGGGRSRPMELAVRDVRSLVEQGYREVVLSGVHLGSYGHDLGEQRGLQRLVRQILAETELPRLRLSSLEPWDLDAGFFEVFADRRLLPHLHLPLQSGCDATLRRMARRTDQESFGELVATARAAVPALSISSDIMVGFPGETDRDFEESLAFVEQMAFSRLHVFRYSAREGTRAATMAGQVPGPVAQQRSRRMHALGAGLEQAFHRRFEGETLRVLWERADEYGSGLRWNGLTDNYIRALTETGSEIHLENEITDTHILAALPGGVLGTVAGLSSPGLIEPESRRLPVR